MANALTLPAMPAMKPAISAVIPSPSSPGPQIARQHQRQHLVVSCGRPGCTASLSGTSFIGSTARPSSPGRITMKGTHILKAAPMIGAILADAQILGGEHALHDQEIGGPVAERNNAAEAEDDARPVDAHGIVAESSPACSRRGCNRPGRSCAVMRATMLAPAAGFDQPQDGNQQRAGPDEDELQNLVEDRRLSPPSDT